MFFRDVAIENLKMVFPYGFEFYSIFQGEFFSIVKWLKLIHIKPKSQPEPLPSDIILKVNQLQDNLYLYILHITKDVNYRFKSFFLN